MGFSTVSHELHKVRRSALNPYFSKRSIAEYSPVIQSVVTKFCTRLEDATQTGVLVNLKYAYAAVTTDVINEYCYSRTYNAVLTPDFNVGFYESVMALSKMCHLVSSASCSFVTLIGSDVNRQSSNKCHGSLPWCTQYRYDDNVHKSSRLTKSRIGLPKQRIPKCTSGCKTKRQVFSSTLYCINLTELTRATPWRSIRLDPRKTLHILLLAIRLCSMRC